MLAPAAVALAPTLAPMCVGGCTPTLDFIKPTLEFVNPTLDFLDFVDLLFFSGLLLGGEWEVQLRPCSTQPKCCLVPGASGHLFLILREGAQVERFVLY